MSLGVFYQFSHSFVFYMKIFQRVSKGSMMQLSVFELLKTSNTKCAFIFIKHQSRGTPHIFIQTVATVQEAFESSGSRMIYTDSPTILADQVLCADPEFNHMSKMARDLDTTVVYADTLLLAEQLRDAALKIPRVVS
ncbi:uncharacterized protein BJ212DRAFT_1478642 [Suillus subaureus]|uniref:Uncharacterized protein n=1 Tax=Suillus subaureus TaxID=48587 RepID=A0A9P7EH62_9AGAM|nr:uncharacterized protein BJ212DRAFT_1478642 [Suillus subaureus]KAG1820529.1 hypothetical protein BJ212DRAFT_1478642 [Suillus subaureus]